jgi:hypothetical protein
VRTLAQTLCCSDRSREPSARLNFKAGKIVMLYFVPNVRSSGSRRD